MTIRRSSASPSMRAPALGSVRATMWMRARFDSAICTCDSMPVAESASPMTRSIRWRTWVLYFSRGTKTRHE